MTVVVDLLPPNMLGRRFQYAALSADPSLVANIDYSAGQAVFHSPDDYADLVSILAEAIVARHTRSTKNSGQASVVSIGSVQAPCGSLDPGPSLYKSGQPDTRILEQTIYEVARKRSVPLCYAIKREGGQIPAWTHAALTYVSLVLEAGGPVGGIAGRLPSLASATLFSKERGAWRPRETGKVNVSIDSLGLALLGGAASFMGRERLAEDAVELYLLPDLVSERYWDLSERLSDAGSRSAVARALWIHANTGASFELTVSLEAGVSLARSYRVMSGLVPRQALSVLSSARLYLVTPGSYRPMVRGAIVIGDLLASSYDVRLLSTLEALASKAAALKDKDSSQAKRAVAGCVSDLFMLTLDPCNQEHAYDCTRSLMALAEDKNVPGAVRELAASLARLASREAARLASRAGCA